MTLREGWPPSFRSGQAPNWSDTRMMLQLYLQCKTAPLVLVFFINPIGASELARGVLQVVLKLLQVTLMGGSHLFTGSNPLAFYALQELFAAHCHRAVPLGWNQGGTKGRCRLQKDIMVLWQMASAAAANIDTGLQPGIASQNGALQSKLPFTRRRLTERC